MDNAVFLSQNDMWRTPQTLSHKLDQKFACTLGACEEVA